MNKVYPQLLSNDEIAWSRLGRMTQEELERLLWPIRIDRSASGIGGVHKTSDSETLYLSVNAFLTASSSEAGAGLRITLDLVGWKCTVEPPKFNFRSNRANTVEKQRVKLQNKLTKVLEALQATIRCNLEIGTMHEVSGYDA
jgi:hypothetical protein